MEVIFFPLVESALRLLNFCSSEGIQLGGIGSAAGVVGSWTAAMHDHG